MTRGEGGGDPAVREQEMIASAALFGGRVIQWSFPDVLSGVSAAWQSPVAEISAVIAAERPATVITLDPTHGTTCHEAHRETGRLVIEAIERLGQSAPPLFLLQTSARLENGVYRFSPGALPTLVFDASLDWQYAVDSATSHRSQFPEALLDALRATPAGERKVWLSRAGLPLRPLRLCGESL